MRCNFCNYEFDEAEGLKSCHSCGSFGGCRKVKCPRCDYEMPQLTGFAKLLTQRRKVKNAENRS